MEELLEHTNFMKKKKNVNQITEKITVNIFFFLLLWYVCIVYV